MKFSRSRATAARSVLPRLAVASMVGALALTGCSSDSSDSRPLVVAAFGPLAWATEQVAGADFRVENLATPGVEAHDIDPTVRQMADIEQADVVVLLDGFQAAVDTAASNVATGRVLDVTEAARLVPLDEHEAESDHAGEGEDHSFADEHEGHDHGDEDPHFWQDPHRMADVVDAIAAELAEAHPEGAETYAERAATIRSELENLDTEYREGLASCARDTVVVSHEAFGYLTSYGLHFEAINGLSPGAEPTPADLARLQRLITEDGITTVFSEENSTKKLAQTLAQDTGVTTAVLDPLESMPDNGDYLSTMRSNLAALQKANDCA